MRRRVRLGLRPRAHPVDLDAQYVGQLERLEVMDADAAERRAHLALGERAHEAIDVELAWAQGYGYVLALGAGVEFARGWG